MAVEAVAKVVRDLKTGRVKKNDELPEDAVDSLLYMVTHPDTAVIDSTPMYDQIVNGPPINVYDEYVMMPVWNSSLIGYENHLGNVNIIQTFLMHEDDPVTDRRPPGVRWGHAGQWDTVNEVDWDQVTYQFLACLWVGGRSPKAGALPTFGPIIRWDVAAYEDGSIADIHWTQIYDLRGGSPEDFQQNAMLIWLQTYTLAGCTNVELVTPERQRPQRKRLDRLGVTPQTLVIKKTSKSYRHTKGDTDDMIGGVPQSFVRGHYARYGPEYGRGLLFGKYAGKFWVPAHARGEGERPEREIDYVTEG